MNEARVDHPDPSASSRLGVMSYATLSLGITALIFLSNWPNYAFEVRGGIPPLYYYAVPAALMLPVFFAQPDAAVRAMKQPLFWWFLAYVASGLIWLLLAQDFVEEASRDWRLRVLGLGLFFAVAILTYEARPKLIGWIMLGCVLMACAFNWLDVLRPHRFVPQGFEDSTPGRGAGFFVNPNTAAAFIALGTLAALPLIPMRLRTALLVAAVFGVAATFSRSGFVLIALTAGLAVAFRLVSRVQGVMLIVGLPLLVAGVSMSYDYLMAASENRNVQTVVQRLAWFQDMGEEDEAVEGRRYGAKRAWETFLDYPVTGRGTGATSRSIHQEGPHNMYLKLLAEQGVIGLLLYISLILILVGRGRRAWRQARTPQGRDLGRALTLCGVLISAYGFFSHNVLEEPYTIFVLGFLMAGACGALPDTARAQVARPVHARALSWPQ